ncbi:DoxX family protein [Kineococcus glutinatus]|uniref:DoxX family protein n=1 Tax=Kineococcus glutinatus TaxID=1070872 RepID=UPI0031EE84EF
MTAPARTDLGLLVLRVGVGSTLFAHGAQKLFGWFGGHGVAGTTGAMESMGFHPPKPSAVAAGLSETGGGALLALGLATPAAGAAVAANMLAAGAVHRPAGFFATEGGFEYPAVLGAAAAALAVAGPGRHSLDRLLGDRLNRPWMTAAALVVSLAASTAVVARRERAVAAAPTSGQEQADEGGRAARGAA